MTGEIEYETNRNTGPSTTRRLHASLVGYGTKDPDARAPGPPNFGRERGRGRVERRCELSDERALVTN